MESNFNPDNEEIEDLALFPSENQNPIIRANLNQILYINKSGKELLDIQKDSKLPEILKEHISESLFSKKNQEFELVLNDQTYSFTITPIKEKDYANIYGRDITERKKIEEQLIYKDNIISSTSSVIATCDLDGIMNFVNPAFFKVWGYDNTNEIYGRHFKEFWVVEPILDEIMDVLTSKGVWFGEIKAKKKDGSFFDIQVSASVVYDNEGDPISLMSSSIDITTRKKAEESLKESEEKFRTLSEQSLVGIAIVQDNQMKYSNRKIAEIIEYPYEEIKDWTLIDHLKIVHPDYVDFVKDQSMKKQQGITDVMEDYEFCIYTKKGDLKWVHVFSKTISYEGRPADLVVQIDITKRKKIEEQLIKSEENYRVAYNNANFYKDLFAHDMNNILNSIKLSVELISETPKEREKMERFNKFFNIIKDSSNRGAQLISNVQKLSKLDESGAIIQDTNVSTYLKDAVSFIKNNFPNKDIEIEVDALSENILVMGNELLLDVFENIMINSVKYNDNKKKEILIKISEIQADGITFLKLEFIDNGMGIKHYRKEKIFEVGNREYKGGRGMGIGLSLVKKIVESYGGKIMVEDKVPGDYSKGSNFTVLIPKSK